MIMIMIKKMGIMIMILMNGMIMMTGRIMIMMDGMIMMKGMIMMTGRIMIMMEGMMMMKADDDAGHLNSFLLL